MLLALSSLLRIRLPGTASGLRTLVLGPLLFLAITVTSLSSSLAMNLAHSSDDERELILRSLTQEEAAALLWDWEFWARPEQLEPAGEWSNWLILAGRGFGKTRTGSEWVRSVVNGSTPLGRGRYGRLALVAETAADARDVIVEGVSGILAVSPRDYRPLYEPSKRRLTWPNGAVATLFSAEDPEQLRGPEHDAAWCDESAKWRYAQEAWDMLQFGLRLGDMPRCVITTTPRPIPLIRELLKQEASGLAHVTRGRTLDNRANLAPRFIDKIVDRYAGTRLGRQELDAELLDDAPGALWTRAMFCRVEQGGCQLGPSDPLPDMQRIVVSIDPSGAGADEEESSNDIGLIVAGLGFDGMAYVLEDLTVCAPPGVWSRRAVEAYYRHRADAILGERNFGGAMVEFVVRSIDRRVNYREVVASRGKALRAEPIAALYEQGRVRHVGSLSAMEDQMVLMTPGGYLGVGSPDRMDAAVWAITDLMLDPDQFEPRTWVDAYGNGRG